MSKKNKNKKITGAMATINIESQEETAMMNNTNIIKEADTMSSQTNSNRKATAVKNVEISKESVMPTEELAVEDSLVLATPNMPDFSSLVLPDEVAEGTDAEQNIVAKYRELGFFSPIRGMTNISNRLDGKIYANIYEDEKGQRNVIYIQEYVNGDFSPRMSLPQAGMRMAAQYKFSSVGIQEPKLRNRISDFILEANDDYYGKFRGALADELDISKILNVLYSALPFLPVHTDKPSEMEEETFYSMLDFHINNLTSWMTKEHKSYYALEENDIETLAVNMEMKKLELLKKMKQYGFLYLTPSSKGYQTNVRLKWANSESYTDWRYCVYKLSYFAGIEVKNPNVLGLDEF